MFDLVSILSRYLFLFYIIYFLWQGIVYILNERDIKHDDPIIASKKQRYTIVLMHIVAFLVLFFEPFDTEGIIDFEVLIMGALSLIFIIFAFLTFSRIYKNACPILLNGVLFLLDVGFIMLQRLYPENALRQLAFSASGFLVMLCIPLVFKIIPKFEKLKFLYLAMGLSLLIVLFFFGSKEYGAVGWLQIGSITFQPSEFVKVFFVLYFASALRKKVGIVHIGILCATAALFVVILVAQRDLGAALIFFMTFMIMLYVSTGSELLFLFGMIAASFASYFAYTQFAHIQQRVAAWSNPWIIIDNDGYQIAQSLFAICTWGPMGSGLLRGQPNAIPVVAKDFIFSAICEEFGSIFGLLLIGVYVMIFYRGVHIALRCKKPFFSLVSVGFTGLLAFQTFIIIAGVTKMIPMTGVTLPFISYGGSSVFICIIMIGFLQWLYRENQKGEPKQSTFDFEYVDLIEGDDDYEYE